MIDKLKNIFLIVTLCISLTACASTESVEDEEIIIAGEVTTTIIEDSEWLNDIRETSPCSYCGSSECESFFGVDEWGQQDLDVTLCPQYDELKDPTIYCQTCGKKTGTGENDTCVQYVEDMQCFICDEEVESFQCHTCSEE